jgi:hypothetical protein
MWRDKFLPGHFKAGAHTKYGYKMRSDRHIRRKVKKGNPPDLVYTGRSRDTLTKRYNFRVADAGKLTVKGKWTTRPDMRYWWMTPKNHPNKPDEMKRLTSKETDEIVAYIKELFVEAMNTKKSANLRVVR